MRNRVFAIYAKTEGPIKKLPSTSIYKLAYCGHFKPKTKSPRCSEAEIQCAGAVFACKRVNRGFAQNAPLSKISTQAKNVPYGSLKQDQAPKLIN